MSKLAGQLLITPPSVTDSFWQKSVIMITEEYDKGTVGVILNKPSKMTLIEFAEQNDVELNVSGFVHIGGPINTKALTMLHTNEWSCSNTLKINNKFSISSSPDILTKLAAGELPNQWRIFVGLCGWTAGQLENEINGIHPTDHNLSWLIAKSNTDIVFEQHKQTQWIESIELAGNQLVQKMMT